METLRGAAEPAPDDDLRRLQEGKGKPPAKVPGGTAAATPSASLTVSGSGTYTDTAIKSTEPVTFNATWSGGKQTDYVIVNWVKGYYNQSDGTPFKAMLYGKLADIKFDDWQVDSADEDPAYWSDSTGRWTYTVDGPGKFSATDNPGPALTSDGKGAKAILDFKTAVYKASDVPLKTAGTLSATPVSSFQTWSYHVEVLGGGKFSHPK